ncbi:MAG: STAS domain-containing protein [Candidatus Brocadiia bacterium]
MQEDGRILVAVFDKTIYVKPMGHATQENCLGLPDFIKAMFREGCNNVTFDLENCNAMDSTFLGVVASAGMACSNQQGKGVLVVNADQSARQEFEMIGLTPVLAFRDEPCEPPPELELSHIDFCHLPNDERERIKTIKEMHEELIELNERNRQNFQGFIDILDEELQEG